MNQIKITCTAEQKEIILHTLVNSPSACIYNDKCQTFGSVMHSCKECLEKYIDWEIVEPIKDFKKLTIAETEGLE